MTQLLSKTSRWVFATAESVAHTNQPNFSKSGWAVTFVEWLETLRQTVDKSFAMPSRIVPMCVVHNQDGGRYTSDGFKKGWQILMRKWVELGGERFTFHDSIAKAVTTTIESGRKASDLTGHKLEATVSRIYDRYAVRKSMPSKWSSEISCLSSDK